MSAELALRVRGLHKSFDAAVLTGLDLDVEPGQLVTLLGPSGCGKTTLLRLVAGFDDADSGSVEVAGTLVEAREDPQCRGLAAAGRAEQRHQLARREVQGEAVECAHLAVDPRQVGELDGEPGLFLEGGRCGRHALCPPTSAALLRLKNESPRSSSEMTTMEAKPPAMAVEVSDL